jgi:translation initiation factor IF-3
MKFKLTQQIHFCDASDKVKYMTKFKGQKLLNYTKDNNASFSSMSSYFHEIFKMYLKVKFCVRSNESN